MTTMTRVRPNIVDMMAVCNAIVDQHKATGTPITQHPTLITKASDTFARGEWTCRVLPSIKVNTCMFVAVRGEGRNRQVIRHELDTSLIDTYQPEWKLHG